MGSPLRKAQQFLTDPDYRFRCLCGHNLGKYLPDRYFLTHLFKIKMGYELHLTPPRTYNEKLQWLKLYDRRPIYTTLVDKYAVKPWVAERIGEEHIIPTLGVWNHFDEINFDALPNQFVLKCTHDSGSIVVVTDKNTMDRAAAREKLERCLARDFSEWARERHYKDVPRRIIAEEYIEEIDPSQGLHDYKILIFDGKAKLFYITSDRFTGKSQTNDFYDMEGRNLPINWVHPSSGRPFVKPEGFDRMIAYAERLAQGFPQMRVDFYIVGSRILFGEMTIYMGGGFDKITPWDYDLLFGSYIKLPQKKRARG